MGQTFSKLDKDILTILFLVLISRKNEFSRNSLKSKHVLNLY